MAPAPRPVKFVGGSRGARARVARNGVYPEDGSKEATLTVDERGAASVVWWTTLPDDGPTGGFFRDGQPLPW